jgi:putative salt-induced outer membrane protein
MAGSTKHEHLTATHMRHQTIAFIIFPCLVTLAHADENGASWQGNAALSFTRSAGNTNGTTYSISVDETRTTDTNKLSAYASALYGKSQGVVSADKTRLGTRYDHNLSPQLFGFGQLEFEQDRMANLDLRSSLGAGFGYHLLNEESVTLDVFGGLSQNRSDMMTGNTVSTSELILAEESTHTLTQNTRLKQKLSYYPSTQTGGKYRTVFDSSLVINLNSTMGLSISLQNKYNSDIGAGVKHSDTVLLTGLNIKL